MVLAVSAMPRPNKRMISIAEKYNKWCEKIRDGCSDFIMITRTNGSWYLVNERRSDKLAVCKIFIQDEGNPVPREYIPSEENYVLLIKNERKMIVKRGEDRFDAFGFETSDALCNSVKMVLCYAYTSSIHLLITAHRSGSSVNMVYSLANKEPDSFLLCMKEIGLLSDSHSGKDGVS